MRQCEPHRIKGWFYLPETPKDRVPGILDWQPDGGATLELLGGFSPPPDFKRTPSGGLRADQVLGDVRPGTIYGESDSGQAVTIWEAQRGNYTVGLTDGLRDEYWHSSWICVGAHILTPQEPVFSHASVSYDELYYLTEDGRLCAPQWTQIEGVDRPGETQPDGTLLVPYCFPVVGGYRAEYASGDTADAHYAIATNATRPFLSPATMAMPDLRLQMMTNNLRSGPVINLQVGAHVSIRLLDSAPSSAIDLVERMVPIDDLLQLATFDATGVERITLQCADKDTTASLLMHTGTVASPSENHKPAAMVFTLSDVPLNRYLEARQRLTDGNQARYAWSVMVGLCGYSSRLVEEYVSQALASAEGFHRWCLQGEGDAYLNTRLKALHNMLDSDLKGVLALDADRWADWAVWARNHVAHGGTKNWRPLRDNFQLHVVAESVHLITYLVALQELGTPPDRLREALRNHPRLSVLAERCTEINDLPGIP
jgi:ApeA N-terminal domain 1